MHEVVLEQCLLKRLEFGIAKIYDMHVATVAMAERRTKAAIAMTLFVVGIHLEFNGIIT